MSGHTMPCVYYLSVSVLVWRLGRKIPLFLVKSVLPTSIPTPPPPLEGLRVDVYGEEAFLGKGKASSSPPTQAV